MITYNWNCKTVDIHPQEDDLTDVVYNIHWKLTGKEGEHVVESIGTVAVVLDPDATFIPFEDLTNSIVTGWAENAIGAEGVQGIKDGIDSQIQEMIAPTSETRTIED
jgi:hypothetical protein